MNNDIAEKRKQAVTEIREQLENIRCKFVAFENHEIYVFETQMFEKELYVIANILFCFGYREQFSLWKNSNNIVNDEERIDAMIVVCESFLSAVNGELHKNS